MRSWIILALYLGDELLSSLMPFSSGIFALCMLVILLPNNVRSPRTDKLILIGALFAVVLGTAGALLSLTPVTPFSFATITLLSLLWHYGSGLADGATLLIPPNVAFVGTGIASALLLLSVVGADAYSLLSGVPTNRASGLFLEPSHLALYVMPLWLIAFGAARHRLVLYGELLAIVAVCFSATLLLFVVCALLLNTYLETSSARRFLSLIGRQLTYASVVVALVFAASSVLMIGEDSLGGYLQSRVYGLISPDDAAARNLSSLVILQGAELARLSLTLSGGLGVGLGNFGTSAPIIDTSDYRDIINSITIDGSDISLRDGGLLASKLVGELGVFSLVVFVVIINHIRRLRQPMPPVVRAFHGAFAALLFCVLFTRALPYFSAPVCVAILSVSALFHASTARRVANHEHAPEGADTGTVG